MCDCCCSSYCTVCTLYFEELYHILYVVYKKSAMDPVNMNSSESEEVAIYVCPICQSTSKEDHPISYGGKACLSCKAFFRRAHQNTKSPTFVCKRINQCPINHMTRKSCQKCRYQLCLKSGMNPDLVLTSDQKKSRFKNQRK